VTPDNPDQIEREMETTRESITAKVAALENQVLGTIQSAASTIQSVKETVTTAPAAVKETVQETVAAMKDTVKETLSSVKETVTSFSLSECVSNHPTAAVGTSFAGGFLAGFFLFGERPLMARGYREPAPGGRPGTVPHEFAPFGHTGASSGHAAHGGGSSGPGMFAGLFGMVAGEIEQLARQALTTAMDSLKRSLNEKVPQIVDGTVQNLADRVVSHTGAADTATGGYATRGPGVTPAVGI